MYYHTYVLSMVFRRGKIKLSVQTLLRKQAKNERPIFKRTRLRTERALCKAGGTRSTARTTSVGPERPWLPNEPMRRAGRARAVTYRAMVNTDNEPTDRDSVLFICPRV